jgi:hypothetical protein
MLRVRLSLTALRSLASGAIPFLKEVRHGQDVSARSPISTRHCGDSNNAQALELATYKVVDLAYGVNALVSSQKNPVLLVLADRKMDDSYAE